MVEGGLFKSVDGGGNWTAAITGLTNTNVFASAIDPKTPTTVYAGTGHGVFKSVDSGTTWMAANTGLPDYETGSMLWRSIRLPQRRCMQDGGGLFKSLDGGATWTAVMTTTYVNTVAIDPITPTNVYAGRRMVYSRV